MPPSPIRFTHEQRARLSSEFHLTADQLLWLERALRDIRYELLRSARAFDVRNALVTLNENLQRANAQVQSWKAMQLPDFGPEALGHLNRAQQGMKFLPSDGTRPAALIASELIELVAKLAERAVELKPEKRRPGANSRVGYAASVRTSGVAIEWMVVALHRPTDASSKSAALALPVARSECATGGFLNLARLVFAAAMGVSEGKINPSRSIDAYLAPNYRKRHE